MYQMTWFWQSVFDNFCKEAQVSGQLLEKSTSFWKHTFFEACRRKTDKKVGLRGWDGIR